MRRDSEVSSADVPQPGSSPTIALVGPLPPGTGGTIRTFEEFRCGLDELGVRSRVVDTGPGSTARWASSWYRQLVAVRLVVFAVGNVVRRRPVLWFISSGQVRSLGWLVPRLAAAAPVTLVSFGGLLGQALCDEAGRPIERRAGWMGAARAVFVQSELTAAEVRAAGLDDVEVLGPTRGAHGVTPRLDVAPRAGRPLHLVYAGRIYGEKGVDDLARLCACAPGTVEVSLIGEIEPGHERAVEQVVAATPGLALLGSMTPPQVLGRLRDADFAVLLSSYAGEGIPGLVAEALVVGTPAIVSDFRGLPEIVNDGENGFVVGPDDEGWDVPALADRLAALSDEDLRALRSSAASHALRFDPARQAARLLATIGVLEGAPC